MNGELNQVLFGTIGRNFFDHVIGQIAKLLVASVCCAAR